MKKDPITKRIDCGVSNLKLCNPGCLSWIVEHKRA
jgi:hypothetical protein